MPVTVASVPELPTIADLIEHLGGIPSHRIRFRPTPGTATERDVTELHDRENRLYELVDGVLVEKAEGFYESLLAATLLTVLNRFAVEQDRGLVAGADGAFRLAPGRVRIPDVSFIAWERLEGIDRRQPIPNLVPNLAVEVLSRGNTPREMQRKCREYFEAGVELVWYLDPEARRVIVYTSPEQRSEINEAGTLDGGRVLPGFTLPLREVFAGADRHTSG